MRREMGRSLSFYTGTSFLKDSQQFLVKLSAKRGKWGGGGLNKFLAPAEGRLIRGWGGGGLIEDLR